MEQKARSLLREGLVWHPEVADRREVCKQK